ncbi:RloB domain-containing protein [uncultured Faecalibacterium sp.]|uniref:RloB domain-containing protein n=1 Tax=uncultured Faecalibacterium sp. TaxID=259315 RepID=UPI0008225827|nr:RloB domain-containing protein [uncultured Faecalibacterium sp.]SCH53219.1 Uncharacterised protein [uncultured Faecalibacterium sp.]
MSIPHRLNAGNRFERPETQSIKRVVFLSVEGEVTERRYFEFVRESRETLGIKSVVEIHVLRRGDSSSSPEKVVELLENYLEVRNNNDFLAEVDKLELKHYDKEFIHKYLEAPDTIDVKEKRQFEGFLKEEQLDLTYLLFLNKFKGSDNGENDVFGIVIDRDAGNHSPENMARIFDECDEKGYRCFLTNPRFEFWLLLHVADVKSEYPDELEKMLDFNDETVDKHLLEKTGGGKKIQRKIFDTYFLPNIDTAIERANGLCTSRNELLDQLGSTLGELFELLRE